MCRELGSDWPKEYEEFYRYALVPTHAGSFTLGRIHDRLLEQQPPTDERKASALGTALALHLLVAEITVNVFPDQINSEAVKELTVQYQELLKLLK